LFEKLYLLQESDLTIVVACIFITGGLFQGTSWRRSVENFSRNIQWLTDIRTWCLSNVVPEHYSSVFYGHINGYELGRKQSIPKSQQNIRRCPGTYL